jgi:predicted nucleic acid-binding Zn ribbon protein
MRRLSQTPTGPGPDPRDPQPLGAVWGRFAQHQGWTEEIAVWSLSTGWAQIVGPQIADHVVVVRFDADAPMAEATPQDGQQTALLPGPHPEQRRSGGRLVLQADSAAWQQQLVWGLGHLQRRLDEALGRGVVGTIVVLGPGQREGRDGPRKGQGRRGPGMRRA